MTENNTLDVIVASAGGVSAPGVANAPAVRFQKATAGTWNVQTALTCAGTEPGGAAPWSVQVGTGAKNPTASPVTASQFLHAVCRRHTEHERPGDVDGDGQLDRRGADGEHAAAGGVRGGHRAGGVAVDVGQPGRGGTAGRGLGVPGAGGPGGGGPVVRAGQPRRVRRLRGHLRPVVPDVPRDEVRDADDDRRRVGHGRPGDVHAERVDRDDRVLGVDRRLHVGAGPDIAVHAGAGHR